MKCTVNGVVALFALFAITFDQENKSFRLVFIRRLNDLVIRKLESISKRMTELNERLISD